LFSIGKDWHTGVQDGGVGHVGTVTIVELDQNTGSSMCTVSVALITLKHVHIEL